MLLSLSTKWGKKCRNFIRDNDRLVLENTVNDRQDKRYLNTFKHRGEDNKNNGHAEPFLVAFKEL